MCRQSKTWREKQIPSRAHGKGVFVRHKPANFCIDLRPHVGSIRESRFVGAGIVSGFGIAVSGAIERMGSVGYL